MQFSTHVLGAVVIASALNLPVIPAVIGSIVPDLDLKKGLPKFRQDRTLFNSHRGITHHLALIPILLFTSVILKDFISKEIGTLLLSFTAGYGSHILLDALTPLGIPYKWGYYPRISLKLFKTGKVGELFVILTLIVILILQIKGGKLDLNLIFGDEVLKSLKEVSGEVLH